MAISIKSSIPVLLIAISMVLFLSVLTPSKVDALSGSEFNAGNIIDDSLFYDGGAMTVDQIQAFLNAKVPTCDTNGTQMHWSGVTRAQRGAANGNPAPFICLKDYRQNTVFKAGESGLCDAMAAKSNQSAAQIIYDVGRACSISQKALLVMLQKEQSLVTDDWPWNIQYRSAMGYGCPDTAPCDAEYYGFFNQIYNAARQFQRYKADPNNWNHIPGANNNILYQANAPHCGTRSVFIENYATAGLYNYTPYTPNQAALNNLYGTGDNCSAYGNRNFWRLYNDWFGSTRGSYLLRSTSDSTVYLVSNGKKYPISSQATLAALYPMGSVKFVSQAYLDSLTTMPVLSRLIKSSEGSTIYFFDAGIKLGFSSCAMVEDYGMTCADYAELEPAQIDKFVTGPNMTSTLKLKSGRIFRMEDGLKREAPDTASISDAGHSTISNTLSDSALNYLEYGIPIVKKNMLISDRSTADRYVKDGTSYLKLDNNIHKSQAFDGLTKGGLDSQSIGKLTVTTLTGYIRNSGASFIINHDGKSIVSTPADWANDYKLLSNEFIQLLANSSTSIGDGASSFYKSKSNGTVYLVSDQEKAAVASWTDLMLLANGSSPTIHIVPDYALSNLGNARLQLGPTRLIKSANDATVYMVDGDNKRSISSFSITDSLDISRSVLSVSNDTLNAYTTIGPVEHLISCGGVEYIGFEGKLRTIDDTLMSEYGFGESDFLQLSSATCARLPKQGVYTYAFIRPINEKTIYKVEAGQRRPISSYTYYENAGGNSANTSVIPVTISRLVPVGPTLQ